MKRFRPRPLDIPLAVLLAAGGIVPWMLPEEPGASVVVSHAGGEMRFSLAEARTVIVEGPVGRTVVRIEDGRAWVADSDCPHKLCVKMGKVEKAGGAVWCVPNAVGLRIEGGTGVDAVTR